VSPGAARQHPPLPPFTHPTLEPRVIKEVRAGERTARRVSGGGQDARGSQHRALAADARLRERRARHPGLSGCGL
jgi:hypothetical protein